MSACGVAEAQRSSEGFTRSHRVVVDTCWDWWNGRAGWRQAPMEACRQGLAYRQWRSLESEARQSNEVLH
jgi:hypothetical protein